MATESESAVLIGFIVTIAIVGIAGGVTLTVFICLKWKEYQKRRAMTRVMPSRQRDRRRNRHHRSRNSITHIGGPTTIELPPPYTEVENDPPPPYTPLGMLQPNTLQREGQTRGSIRSSLTPIPQGRTAHLPRNPNFGSHLNTGTTNTPMVTPTGSMFRSSYPGTRQQSATSNTRSINMVQFENEHQGTNSNSVNFALNIHVENNGNHMAHENAMENG